MRDEDEDRLLVRPYISGRSYQLPESGRPLAADGAPAGASGGDGTPPDEAVAAGSTSATRTEDGAAAVPAGREEAAAPSPRPGEATAPLPEVRGDGTDPGSGTGWANAPADRTGEAAGAPRPRADEVPTAHLPQIEGPAPAATPAVPGPDPALDDRDRQQVLWLVGIGIAIALAAVAGLIALWPSTDENPPAAGTAPLVAPADEPSAAATAPRASATTASSPARSGTATARPTTPATTEKATTRPAAPPPASATPPDPTLAPPPAADRVGAITTPAGRCLDVAGGIVLPGSSLAVRACNSTLSQRWTLATDGTLRVSGSCAVAGADAVTVGMCGGAPAGQWRAGPDRTLVNVDSGRCLTESDGSAGTSPCGGAGQRWTLP